jgi:hypothetical protein
MYTLLPPQHKFISEGLNPIATKFSGQPSQQEVSWRKKADNKSDSQEQESTHPAPTSFHKSLYLVSSYTTESGNGVNG